MLLVVLATHGPNITPEKPFSPMLAFASGCCLFWFTMTDIVDGLRARRMGCGSPLGRLIDEAGDIIIMGAYSVIIGNCMMFDNIILELCFLYMTIGFYGMELKALIFPGQIDMTIPAGISPVEIEVFLACMLWSIGIFGSEWM